MCSDPDRDWYPQATVCYATMVQAAATADYHARTDKAQWHDGSFLPGPQHWAKERGGKFRFHRDHGVSFFASLADLRLGELILTGKPPPDPASVEELQGDGEDE